MRRSSRWIRRGLRAALGITGDVDYYIKVKRGECQAAHEQITDWELNRYLELF
jgi:glutamine synthetase